MRAIQLRSPWLAVVTLTAAGAAAAGGYGLTAPKEYRATAQLLVSPVPATDSTYTGIDVLRDSGGKRTAAASAAALVKAPLVADAVRAQLGLHRSRDALLSSLDAHVADSSDVVDVTVEDGSAVGAAQLANAFADTLVNQRTASFDRDVAGAIARDTHTLATLPAKSPAAAHIRAQLAELRPLAGAPDPTLRHAGQATPPSTASWPDAGLLALLGAAIGLGAGALAVILLALLRARRGRAGLVGAYDPAMSEQAIERLVDRLDARLAARESAFRARERDVQRALDDLRAAQASTPRDAQDLARRERELEERVAAVTRRELEVARRAAELAVLAAQPVPAPQLVPEPEPEPGPPSPEPAPEPPPEPLPGPPAAAEVAATGSGPYNLVTLERLVEERSADHPDRADEWSAYLYFLREHAAADGSVPASFDWLIADTFAELLA